MYDVVYININHDKNRMWPTNGRDGARECDVCAQLNTSIISYTRVVGVMSTAEIQIRFLHAVQ